MKKRYCLIRRSSRGGTFYSHDLQTGKRESLETKDQTEAERLVNAKNEAERQPFINLQIAKAYLCAMDEKLIRRTWAEVFDAIIAIRKGPTQVRWMTARNDKAFRPILNKRLIETTADDFLAVLKANKVSTLLHLRKIHNFALDMDWLPKSIIPRRQWPAVVYAEKRGITWEEHGKILAGERDAEWKAFYNLLWHTGGSQSDIASLKAEDIEWKDTLIVFRRAKTGSIVHFRFGHDLESILSDLPGEGPLFPNLSRMRESDRAKQFIRRCGFVGVKGVSLHSYRYAWAERARKLGYPERFAQEALGHNSKAVHRAYAKHTGVKVPSLEDYARKRAEESKNAASPT